MANLLIINANPNSGSFCEAIAYEYAKKNQNNYDKIELFEIKNICSDDNDSFSLDENIIKEFQNHLLFCDELVIITPNWWNGIPAIFKYLLEKSLLQNFAFKYTNNFPKGLLDIKKAKVIITQDSPCWYTSWILKDSLYIMLKKGVLEFCGVKKVEKVVFGNVKKSSLKQREKWLREI